MARHERFVSPSHSLHIKRANRHMSIVERHLAMLRLAEEEKRLNMEDEKQIFEHLMDFKQEEGVDDDGFPTQTRYQIPDSVPDMLIYPDKEEATPAPEKDVTPPPSGNPQPE